MGVGLPAPISFGGVMTQQILWNLMLFLHGCICALAAIGGIKAGLSS